MSALLTLRGRTSPGEDSVMSALRLLFRWNVRLRPPYDDEARSIRLPYSPPLSEVALDRCSFGSRATPCSPSVVVGPPGQGM
jgi:hypothetical protein